MVKILLHLITRESKEIQNRVTKYFGKDLLSIVLRRRDKGRINSAVVAYMKARKT